MKIILFISLVFLSLSGCKKEEPSVPMSDTTKVAPAPVPPNQPRKPQTLIEFLPPPLANFIRSQDAAVLHDPMKASQIYLNLPDSAKVLPFPPPLMPFHDLRLVERTDSTALFRFKTSQSHTEGEMYLVRFAENGDTIWIPLHILPKPAGAK